MTSRRRQGRPPGCGATSRLRQVCAASGRDRAVVRAVGRLLGAWLVASAVTASAQVPSSASHAAGPVEAGRAAALTARYHVRQMENVLEHAVQHAADMMRRRLQAVTPDVLALAGAPRAQGYRLDGYGLFFSVEVPRLSESVNWALRVLSQDRDERVLASLQKVAAEEQDPAVRADIERAIRTMQIQLTGLPDSTGDPTGPQRRAGVTTAAAGRTEDGVSASVMEPRAAPASPSPAVPPPPATTGQAAPAPPAPLSTAPVSAPEPEQAAEPMRDPSAAYEDEVKQALVDAMLDYAGSLPLPAAEWVTVAARDAGYVAFPDAVTDMVTVTLSVRVADLIEFRAQRLTREEARTRVLVREF